MARYQTSIISLGVHSPPTAMSRTTSRLDFRHSFVSALLSPGRSAGSFPKQRLVMEPLELRLSDCLKKVN